MLHHMLATVLLPRAWVRLRYCVPQKSVDHHDPLGDEMLCTPYAAERPEHFSIRRAESKMSHFTVPIRSLSLYAVTWLADHYLSAKIRNVPDIVKPRSGGFPLLRAVHNPSISLTHERPKRSQKPASIFMTLSHVHVCIHVAVHPFTDRRLCHKAERGTTRTNDRPG